MRNVEAYQTPPGKVDFPFIYIYDASGLTDGTNVQNIQVPLQGDSDFVLRSIKGTTLCVAADATGRFNYRNPSQSYPNNMESTGIVAQPNFPILPEKTWPIGSSIFIDLYNVLRDVGSSCAGPITIFDSFIAFQGVKRFQGPTSYANPQTKYNFKRKAQTYQFPLTINTPRFNAGGGLNLPTQYTQLITNYDFELYSIRITAVNAATPLVTNDFQITLYDRSMHATSNLPVNQAYINSGYATGLAHGLYRAYFPAPILLYPVGSQIAFDIWSMLCAAVLPQSYDISFVGAWRVPC